MTKLESPKRMTPNTSDAIRVVVTNEGPYFLYGMPPVVQQFIMPDKMGESWYYKAGECYDMGPDPETPTSLCRCGESKNKPYCDGAHAHAEWDPTLTADKSGLLDGAQYVEGDELVLSDNEKYCSFARFCHPGGGVWELTENSGDPEARKLAIREASMCPSARLMAWGRGEDNPYEFDFAQTIGLLEDPAIGASGGIWLRGGISVETEGGESYELRNRVVLCRCGASRNKPYCDGSHASTKWKDGLASEPLGEELPDGELVVE